MKTSSIIAGAVHVLVQVHLASAAPVDSSLVERQSAYGVRFWAGADFTGKTKHYQSPSIASGACYDVTAEFPPGTDGGISSVIADAKSECTLYPNNFCNPGNWGDNEVITVGSAYYDLGNPEHSFGDKIRSFKCKYVAESTWAGWPNNGP